MPLISERPEIEMMTERPKIASPKYSTGPNSSATLETKGDAKVMINAPTTPPKNEANSAMAMARPASPRFAIGYPSMTVAAAAGVPGVLMRMAEMAPPYMAPQ